MVVIVLYRANTSREGGVDISSNRPSQYALSSQVGL